MNNYKRSVFIIAGIAFAAFLIFITTFFGKVVDAEIPSQRLGDWIANWIHAYQTLLSAIIATAGVLLTIIAMNKNNKELLYVEWRTLVFKAMSINSFLSVARDAHNDLTMDKINRIDSLATLNAHVELVYSILIRTQSTLNNVSDTDLNLYTQGQLSSDLVVVENVVNYIKPQLEQFTKLQSYEDFSMPEYKKILYSMYEIYDYLNQRSGKYIDNFIDHSTKFNPMSLHVKGFNVVK